ncbi:hypothetical protein G6F68_012187 [Rhizopus microsporus]|nr:hypothetical protein G6F68_012187 [Rhizopus microsporus]
MDHEIPENAAAVRHWRRADPAAAGSTDDDPRGHYRAQRIPRRGVLAGCRQPRRGTAPGRAGAGGTVGRAPAGRGGRRQGQQEDRGAGQRRPLAADAGHAGSGR